MDKEKIDILNIRKVELSNDVYSLIWAAEKKDCWEKLHNDFPETDISLTSKDKRYIRFLFLVFIIALLFTLSLILLQVFTTEIEVICPIQITILRILLVYLVQINLTGEFRQSLLKLKYCLENKDEFYEPYFAALVSFFQFFIALASHITLLLFICTESAPLDMIMDFTGIVVFVELDDWIGEKICSSEPNLDDETLAYYDKNTINEKMPTHFKLAKIQYYLEIIEELSGGVLSFFISIFGRGKHIYTLFPLLVLVVERLYIEYHPYVAKV